MDTVADSAPTPSAHQHVLGPRPIGSIALAWLAMVGVDLALRAGLLAPLYDWDSPFLLDPAAAFARIPVGYLGFLMVAIGLAWLLTRLAVARAVDGARIAGAVGAVSVGAMVLGLWSISTAAPTLLVGWWAGQTVAMAVAGGVIGAVLGGTRLRTVAGRVGLVLAAGILSAVILQTIGYATVVPANAAAPP